MVRVLRDLGKLRTGEDEPDSPTYVRDRTPLRQGQMTTAALRNEFRRDPALPMLVGDDVFVRGIRRGVESGDYVYRQGELVYGAGDPMAAIAIDEQAAVLTMAFAKNKGVWPRREESEAEKEEPPPKKKESDSTGRVEPIDPQAATFHAEGLLKEALAVLWEQARSGGFDAIARMEIRVFDPGGRIPPPARRGRDSGHRQDGALRRRIRNPGGWRVRAVLHRLRGRRRSVARIPGAATARLLRAYAGNALSNWCSTAV